MAIEVDGAGTPPGNSHQYVQNLPVFLTPLVGREQDLQVVRARLLRPEVRLLTLTGPMGVGKTRLAIELSTSMQKEFTQGVCFVSLAPVSDPDLVIPTITHTLGLPESRDRSPQEQLAAYLREKHLLLLLDNFEHLLPAASLLPELLATSPQVKLLVTSRAVLRVQGEYEFPVPLLATPDVQHLPTLDSLSRLSAVELFVQRAEAHKPGFALTEDNVTAIAQICARLEGLPLAIELAAARCKLLPPQALLSRLEHPLAVLTGGNQDAPLHQRTLRQTIAWSYDLLSTEQQMLFRCLCIFVGEFTLDAAEAVASALSGFSTPVLEGIASMVDSSLAQQREEEGREPRLHLLEALREYGIEQLEALGELERGLDAHATYYLALAEQAEPGLDDATQLSWLEVLDREYENIRVAMQWLIARRDAQGALRIAAALRQFWFLRGRLREGIGELAHALEAGGEANEANMQGADQVRAKALYALGYLLFFSHEQERAAVLLQESLDLYRRLQDQRGIADSLRWLGVIVHNRGEVVQGIAMGEESLSLSRAIGDSTGSAYALNLLGGARLSCGEYDRAYQLYKESLALSRAMGNMWASAANLHFLGMVQLALGAITEARSLAEESLALMHRFKTPYLMVEVLTVYAFEATALGEERRANVLMEKAQALARQTGNTEDLARMCWGAGHLALRQGNLDVACDMYVQCVEALQGKATLPRFKWVIASCLEGLAEIALAGKQALWAVQLVGAAEAVRHAHGYYSPLCKEQPYYDRILETARGKLGKQAFAKAWAAGQQMTPQQALAAATPLPWQDASVSPVKPQAALVLIIPKGLTAREVEVLRLVAQGMSNNQIAEQLVLSPNTVNAHIQSIYRKLDVNSRSAATRFAVEHHLV